MPQAYTSANQLSGWNYDASGNLLIDGLNNGYAYDAEGRISGMGSYVVGTGGTYTFTPSYNYIYDAEGNRVSKTGGTAVDDVYFAGKELARLAGTQWTDLIYGTGGLLAEVPGTQAGSPVYRMTDHLGTGVGTLDSNGTLLSLSDYAPFGQTFAGGTNDSYKFTGKERDTESGNDYFGARYYASSMGRWMSPDRLNLTDDRVLNPANTLNKYVYGGNNPLKFVDPDGKDITVFYEAPSGPTSPGHIMFVATNEKTGDAAAMSFGPVHDAEYGFTPLGSPVNSTKSFDSSMTTDELRQNFSSLTIQTSPEDGQEVINFIRQMSTSTAPYSLYNTNCTTVCREALKVIGLLPKDNKNWTPTSLWKNLFGRYAGPYWHNTFGWSGSHPGTNYGQPRGNYNEFDLLELLIKPDNSSVTTSQGPATACGYPGGPKC